MIPQKLIVTIFTLVGGAIGLFAPIGIVKWVMRTDPEDAGILTLFFLPVWCLLLVLGLLIGRRCWPGENGSRVAWVSGGSR